MGDEDVNPLRLLHTQAPPFYPPSRRGAMCPRRCLFILSRKKRTRNARPYGFGFYHRHGDASLSHPTVGEGFPLPHYPSAVEHLPCAIAWLLRVKIIDFSFNALRRALRFKKKACRLFLFARPPATPYRNDIASLSHPSRRGGHLSCAAT